MPEESSTFGTNASRVISAFKLYTGADGASHVVQGTLRENAFIDATAVRFEESPPHSALDFLLRPGEVLVAADDIGTGHKWSLIGDDPWRRAYVLLTGTNEDAFVPR
jgi:hypothetical protein